MMHKAWSIMKEVPYCFSRSSVKFQGKIRDKKKSPISTRIERFRTVTPAWIPRWPWNDAQSFMLYGRGTLLFFLGHPSNFRVTWALKIKPFGFNMSKIIRPVAAIKSLIFALFIQVYHAQVSIKYTLWKKYSPLNILVGLQQWKFKIIIPNLAGDMLLHTTV